MSNDCIFCKIAAGEMGGEPVFQDDQITAFRDINPQAPTHILVIPNRHIESVSAAGDDDRTLLGQLLLAAAQVAESEGIANRGYRLVINTGPQGGQSVSHIHVHILGGRQMTWPPG